MSLKGIRKKKIDNSSYSTSQHRFNMHQMISLFNNITLRNPKENEIFMAESVDYNVIGDYEMLLLNQGKLSHDIRNNYLLIYNRANNTLKFTDKDILTKQTFSDSSDLLIIRSKVSLYDYSKFEMITKLKVCLNIVRDMIFKSNSDFCNVMNVKNTFFFQVFKKFERFYSIPNFMLDHSILDISVVKELIRKVELAYFEVDLNKPLDSKRMTFAQNCIINSKYLQNCS